MKVKHRYTPILKDKAGELGALRELKSRTWEELTPLIELSQDKGANEPEWVKETVTKIERASSFSNVTLLLDFSGLSISATSAEALVKGLESRERSVIPVLEFGDKLLSPLVSSSEQMAVRLRWRNVSRTISADVGQFAKELSLKLDRCHLIFDIGEISRDQVGALAATIPALLTGIARINEWATVTIAATSFPKILEVTPTKLTTLPRLEWRLWQSIAEEVSKIVRRLDFGDYTVTNPQFIEIDPKKMTVSPKIVYATEDQWAILKGKGPKANGGGWGQCKQLCHQIKNSSYYLGPGFSFGSDQVARCAAGSVKTGNSTTWKLANTNHHLTLVGSQIASLSVS